MDVIYAKPEYAVLNFRLSFFNKSTKDRPMYKKIKAIVILLFLCFLPARAEAIPKELQAKSEIMLAEEKFDMGEYASAIPHLIKGIELMGATDSNIQYFLTVSHYQLKQYPQAQKELEAYFNSSTNGQENSEQKDTMVRLISKIQEGLDGKNPPPLALKTKSAKTHPAGAHRSSQGDKWISLEEAKKNGIPVPVRVSGDHKFREGRVLKSQYFKRGFKRVSSPGLLGSNYQNEKIHEESFFTKKYVSWEKGDENVLMHFIHENISNPQFSRNQTQNYLAKDMLKYRSFPVSLLKPGVVWTEKHLHRGKAPRLDVKMAVTDIKNVNGHDCVEVSGNGRWDSDDRNGNYATLKIDFCYDYTIGEMVYYKRHDFVYDYQEVQYDVVEERKLISFEDN